MNEYKRMSGYDAQVAVNDSLKRYFFFQLLKSFEIFLKLLKNYILGFYFFLFFSENSKIPCEVKSRYKFSRSKRTRKLFLCLSGNFLHAR